MPAFSAIISNGETMNNYTKLTEATLNRLISGHDKDGYIIISASRGDKTTEENNKRFAELKKTVKMNGYSFIPVFGGYKEDGGDVLEKSLYVLPISASGERTDFERFIEDMVDIASAYDQEAILVKKVGEDPRYYNLKDATIGAPFTGVTVNDVLQQYFTALKKWDTDKYGDSIKGSPQRFTFQELYLDEQPRTIAGAHMRRSDGEIVCYDRSKK